jgi:hypothetical protein
LLGYYEQFLFQIPENELVMGFMVENKQGVNEIKSRFVRVDENVEEKAKKENSAIDLLGTIKLSVDFFGYNHKIMKNYGWI